MKQKTYLERGAVMVQPGTSTGDKSLYDVVGGAAQSFAPMQASNEHLISAKSAKQEYEDDTDYDEDSDDTDVDVDVTISDDDDDMEDDEMVDCGEPGDDGYDECVAEQEEMEDDESMDTRSAKADLYKPPQLMSATQLYQRFSQG